MWGSSNDRLCPGFRHPDEQYLHHHSCHRSAGPLVRVIVTGSRTWTNKATIWGALWGALLVSGQLTVVHGDCLDGADAIAKSWCDSYKEYGVIEEPHPANWDLYGKPAGFIRNREMADLGADYCLAFIGPGPSKGTRHMVKKATKAGIRVLTYDQLGNTESHGIDVL